MIIGVDVDGVILDYVNIVRTYAELYDFEQLHKNGIINKQGFKVKDRYDWTPEELKYFADNYFNYLTTLTNFNPLAIEIINRLHNEGNQIYIISNRGVRSDQEMLLCEELFKKNNLMIDKYFWKINDKLEVIQNNNVDIMIDDSYHICKQTSDNHIPTLYFREKGSTKIESDYIYDVDNWAQIYRVIKSLNN